jgi:hypothetical protein
MISTVLLGLTVTSHQNNTLNPAVFDHVSVTSLPPGISSWSALQNVWFAAGEPNTGPEAHANKDGLVNLLASSAGLSPWIRATPENGGSPIVGLHDGFLTMTYTRLRHRFDFDCVVEVSGDLVTWNYGRGFTVESGIVPLDDVREQVSVHDAMPAGDSNQRFIRLRGIYPR